MIQSEKMFQSMKKLFAGLLVATAVLAMPASANAAEIATTSASFPGPWEKIVSNSAQTATLKYGFDMFSVDEDYAHAYHTTSTHSSYVKNSRGAFTNNASAKTWAKTEVVHAGSAVTYKCIW